VTGAGEFVPTEIAPGLWRWTATHPAWRPGAAPDSPADWDREVGSILWRSGEHAVFIDALLPDDRAGFWRWADERVMGADRVCALTTIEFHRRDSDLVAERYSADTSRARAALPEGIEAIPLRGAGEVEFWLSRERTLVPGDRVLGGREGGLRMCPQSWLNYLSSPVNRTDLSELLRPLLDLPIERVLVSHGQPVLAGGRAALAEAIG
jgi:hypothetical protein